MCVGGACACVSVCMCVCVCVCVGVWLCVYMHLRVFACVSCVCWHVFACVCVRACMHAYAHVGNDSSGGTCTHTSGPTQLLILSSSHSLFLPLN